MGLRVEREGEEDRKDSLQRVSVTDSLECHPWSKNQFPSSFSTTFVPNGCRCKVHSRRRGLLAVPLGRQCVQSSEAVRQLSAGKFLTCIVILPLLVINERLAILHLCLALFALRSLRMAL